MIVFVSVIHEIWIILPINRIKSEEFYDRGIAHWLGLRYDKIGFRLLLLSSE